MWPAPFQSDDFLSAFGPIQPSTEIPAEQEEPSDSREYLEVIRGLNQDLEEYLSWQPIRDEAMTGYNFVAFPPSPVSETDESDDPRRWERSAAPSPEPIPPPAPSPPVPGAWDRGRACVVNATNTYWSYGRDPGYSQETKIKLEAYERLYKEQPNGNYHWAVFDQQARGTLAAQSRLNQMVEAVGGDPASFKTRVSKADYVLAREAPTGVVHEEDDEEMFSVSFPIDLGQPASGFFWGVGHLNNGTLTMRPSTQRQMVRF